MGCGRISLQYVLGKHIVSRRVFGGGGGGGVLLTKIGRGPAGSDGRGVGGKSKIYVARDLFPWEMLTKTMISCFLNVGQIWNSAQINLSSTLKFYRRYFLRRNNIHREIDQWNRRRFVAKWHVTAPNSVTPIKPFVCKWIYMSHGLYC